MQSPHTILSAATGTGAGSAFDASGPPGRQLSFVAHGTTSAGSGAAAIKIEVSLDGTRWVTLGNIVLTLGVAETYDGFIAFCPWLQVRANVESISGTDASVTVKMGG